MTVVYKVCACGEGRVTVVYKVCACGEGRVTVIIHLGSKYYVILFMSITYYFSIIFKGEVDL